ncbi:MAG: glycosyltransferase family A protein [Candidatus Saccharimonadales bacterium]
MTEDKNIPFVSVIMPVYNAERYLEQAIESILAQSYTDFEFIIINDGSTDKSWDIITSYAEQDPRIKSINQQNKGVVETTNYAANIANGVYLARADADDISFRSKLYDLVKCAKSNTQADVIVGSIEVIDNNDEFVYRELVPIYDEDIKRAMYMRNPVPNGATLIKRSIFQNAGGFADVFAEDFHLWVRLAKTATYAGTGTTVYKWRMNTSGLTFTNLNLSMQKETEYTELLWGDSHPKTISRQNIITRANEYLSLSSRFRIDYKIVFLTDLSRLSVHRIKRGDIVGGFWQLLILASTGRTGLRIALKRVSLVVRGFLHKPINNRPSSNVSTHEEGLEDRSM